MEEDALFRQRLAQARRMRSLVQETRCAGDEEDALFKQRLVQTSEAIMADGDGGDDEYGGDEARRQ